MIMRNSADFISLDRAAKALDRLPGVAMVQSITRPMGRALEHATIPYLFTTQGSGSGQQLPFNKQQNANTNKQAQITEHTVAVLRKEIGFFQKMSDELHKTVLTVEDLQRVTDEMNEEISNLDDFFRPIKSYFYWERHCFDIPDLLGIQIGIRHARPHRQVGRGYQGRQNLPRGHRQDLAANHHAAETHGRRLGGFSRSFGQHLRPVVLCSPRRPTRHSSTRSMWGSTSTSPAAMTSSTSPTKVSTTKTSRRA